MIEILGLIIPLFGLILLGYVAAKFSNQSLEALGWLNTFIIYFALPAMFFKLLSTTPIEQLASWNFILVNLGITFGIFVIGFALGMLNSERSPASATIQGLGSAYGNIGYMGPSIALLALGEKAAVPVAIIFCFENIMHFTIAPAMMAISGQKQQSALQLIWQIISSIILHPFIIATAVGVIAASIMYQPPLPIMRLIDYLAQAAAPCALFVMGVTIALRPVTRFPWALTYIVPLKLIIHPLLMYVGLSYLGDFDPLWVRTAVVLAALPIATNVFVIAQQYNVWVERASASVMVSTLISVVTVSGFLYAITTGLLPADLF